jgi:hypothetical protein
MDPPFAPGPIIDVAPEGAGVQVVVGVVGGVIRTPGVTGSVCATGVVVSAAALDGSCAGGFDPAQAAEQRTKVTAAMVVFMSVPLV